MEIPLSLTPLLALAKPDFQVASPKKKDFCNFRHYFGSSKMKNTGGKNE